MDLEIILEEEVSGKSCSELVFGRVLKQESLVRMSHIFENSISRVLPSWVVSKERGQKSLNIMPLRPRASVVFSWCGNMSF